MRASYAVCPVYRARFSVPRRSILRPPVSWRCRALSRLRRSPDVERPTRDMLRCGTSDLSRGPRVWAPVLNFAPQA